MPRNRTNASARSRPWWLTALASLALIAAACSDSGSAADEDGDEQSEAPADDLVDGPAPARWSGDAAYRVDRASVDGEQLELVVTIAARAEQRIDDEDVRLLTSSGIELPRPEEQERTISAGSTATMTITSDGLTEPTSTVELELLGLATTVELPDGDGTHRWEPAPLRQAGFEGEVVRDRSPVAIVPYTVRSEGLVTEITFLGVTTTGTEPSICRLDCRLEDSSGREYPAIGGPHAFPDAAGARVQGTLRFLGQIPPEETDLRLFVDGWSGFVTLPDPNLELAFTLPTADDSDLAVSWSDRHPDPFAVDTVLDAGGGRTVQLGEISFHEDRIQLDVTASAVPEYSLNLDWSGDSLLRDSSGYEHPLAPVAGGGELSVPAGSTLETTLVFLSPLAPGTTRLDLELALSRDVTIVHTIEIPPASERTDDDAEEDG